MANHLPGEAMGGGPSNIEEWLNDSAATPAVPVRVDDILPGRSSRFDMGRSADHVRLLAEISHQLPPIIVHGPTMTIIDGFHRLEAARLRGEREIQVRYFDGSEQDAFALAIQSNVRHGLPLSLAERKAAAARLVLSHPHWSDRLIASVTGLSHKTVGSQRGCASGDFPQLHGRVGKDGKVRPAAMAEGRSIAEQAIRLNPGLSLREVARIAGISPGTVRDVRRQVGGRTGPSGTGPVPARTMPVQPTAPLPQAIFTSLRNDPALRFNERGRSLLRQLAASIIDFDAWKQMTSEVPEHCVGALAKLARANAESWSGIAQELEEYESIAVAQG